MISPTEEYQIWEREVRSSVVKIYIQIIYQIYVLCLSFPYNISFFEIFMFDDFNVDSN